MQTVRQVVDDEAAADFVLLQIFGAFGVFALILSAVGVYSVVSYSVSERTHEFGVRMALGARSGNIYKQVIRQGMVVTLLGLIVGLAGGYGFGVMASATLSPLIDADRSDGFCSGHDDPGRGRAAGLLHPGTSGGECRPDRRPALRIRGRSE